MLSIVLLLFLVQNLGGVFSTDEYGRKDFPPGFIFGSGTSAYQVEGAANLDGRSPSIWDTFVHEGSVHGATGDVAVDGYHKYKEDVKLMAETGLEAYRFSISWSRLIPDGRGPVNPKGLQYYNNFINELISNGIQPHATLQNYDHPQIIEDEYGGWISRKMVEDFVAYADVCFREFGDRVSHWTTVNEPNIFSVGGYSTGIAPPKRCSYSFCSRGNSSTEPYLATHHMLLAHAYTAKLYKSKYQFQHGFIGLSVYTIGFASLTNSTKDVTATQRARDFFLGWIVDPLMHGEYPSTMKKIVGSRLPEFTSQESELVKDSFDFIGVIHYTNALVEDDSKSLESENRGFNADLAIKLISDIASPELPIAPWGLKRELKYLREVYGNPPVYIHENGQRNRRNSSLEDTSRVKYLQAYIGATLDEIRNGSDVRGYFLWSFLDVLELLDGYQSGYGLYYVDLDDPALRRYPKLSASWYSQFLKGGNAGSHGTIDLVRNLPNPVHVDSF